MSRKIVLTKLEGYPIQHHEITDIINNPLDNLQKRGFSPNNSFLEKIGKSVSSFATHKIHPTTKDNYTWLSGLVYSIGEAKVAILFPWAQDWDNPLSTADRSVGVYSTRKIEYVKIKSLLEKIAHQIEQLNFNDFPYSSH